MSYAILRQAIQLKRCVTAYYDLEPRHFAPHCLGESKDGHMNVLGFQYGGKSSGKLPNWRCYHVSDLRNVTINGDQWHTASDHSRPNTCVNTVHAEVTR